MNTALGALESQELAAQVMASYTGEETRQMLVAPDHGAVASPLGEVSFESHSGKPPQIIISAMHQNPAAAVIIANRYASEFLRLWKSVGEQSKVAAIHSLKERVAEIELRVRAAKETVGEVESTNDALNSLKAEDALSISRQINRRIKEIEDEPSEMLPVRISNMAVETEKVDWWRF